jgi:hypothetical protein
MNLLLNKEQVFLFTRPHPAPLPVGERQDYERL